jgi:hypothetical protein
VRDGGAAIDRRARSSAPARPGRCAARRPSRRAPRR